MMDIIDLSLTDLTVPFYALTENTENTDFIFNDNVRVIMTLMFLLYNITPDKELSSISYLNHLF